MVEVSTAVSSPWIFQILQIHLTNKTHKHPDSKMCDFIKHFIRNSNSWYNKNIPNRVSRIWCPDLAPKLPISNPFRSPKQLGLFFSTTVTNLNWKHIPYAPCMEYLPTCAMKCVVNVGKYSSPMEHLGIEPSFFFRFPGVWSYFSRKEQRTSHQNV